MEVVTKAVREENNIPEKVQKLMDEIDAQIERKEAEENEKAEKIERAEENEMTEENEMAEIEIVEVKKLNDKTHNAYAAGINAIEAKVEADIEFAIQRYNAKLEKLKEFTDSMLESGDSFERTIDN